MSANDWRSKYAVDDPATNRYIFEDPSSRFQIEYKFITPFEEHMTGGSLPDWSKFGREGTVEDHHTPKAVLNGTASPEEAQYVREKLKFRIVSATSIGLGRSLEDTSLVVTLEPIDLNTGVTVRDPRIPGTWDKKTKTIHPIERRDLTDEVYTWMRKSNQEGRIPKWPLREGDQNTNLETNQTTSVEKK